MLRNKLLQLVANAGGQAFPSVGSALKKASASTIARADTPKDDLNLALGLSLTDDAPTEDLDLALTLSLTDVSIYLILQIISSIFSSSNFSFFLGKGQKVSQTR